MCNKLKFYWKKCGANEQKKATENNNKHIKWFQLLYVGCNNVELVPQIDEQVQIPSKLEH